MVYAALFTRLKTVIRELYFKLIREYCTIPDEFSRDIILGYIAIVLKYVQADGWHFQNKYMSTYFRNQPGENLLLDENIKILRHRKLTHVCSIL